MEIQSNVPMDPEKKLEVANLVMEAIKNRRWLWRFLGISIVFCLVRILHGDSVLLLIGNGACLVLAFRCYRKVGKLIDKATSIVVEKAEKANKSVI